MAIFLADTVASRFGRTKANAADNSVDRQVIPQRQGGRRRSISGRFEAAGEAIGSVLRMAWVPFEATIKNGRLAFEAQGAGALCKLGIVGVSGTDFDNDDDLFLAAGQDIAAAGELTFPAAALAAVGTERDNKPGNYKVTDPDGAYIILTTAGAVLGTGKDIDIDVEYVKD
jgi:hypothetical protein